MGTKGNWPFFALLLIIAIQMEAVSGREPAPPPAVHVLLWFDTEDYILPESDDALLRILEFLSRHQVKATFKMVGEKARTLASRNREDILDLLRNQDIGYHTDFHSVHPTPASYLSTLGWFDGIKEFNRRERQGFDDVKRILGKNPSCYGQPGDSWAPQAYGALREWGIPVYMDAGEHISVGRGPFWYCGLLNFFSLKYTTRTELGGKNDLEKAKQEFTAIYHSLTREGAGIVNIYYHPCEFAQKAFWDGVNFAKGANPARSQWQFPPKRSALEADTAHQTFEEYILFVQGFPGVRFTTALETPALFPDHALGRWFSHREIVAVASRLLREGVSYFKDDAITLSAAESLYLASRAVANLLAQKPPGAVQLPAASLLGPGRQPPPAASLKTDLEQLHTTLSDVLDFMETEGRVPEAVWLGSRSISPESFLLGLAGLLTDDRIPSTDEGVEFREAKLAAGNLVRNDPSLWSWPIFPQGFDAPEMMELARRQAWTLKPAILVPPARGAATGR